MMDKDYLYQIDIREWIERGLDADIMVPVSGNKIDKKYDIYLQSFLLPLNEVENDMENDTYNAHTLMPGITVYGSWEDDEKVYHRCGGIDSGFLTKFSESEDLIRYFVVVLFTVGFLNQLLLQGH